MNQATFDPSQPLTLYFRCNRNGSLDFVFVYEDGDPYSLIYEDVELNIYEFEGSKKKIISLTAGSGMTHPSTGTARFTVTATQTNINEGEYYFELYRPDLGRTWLSGDAIFHNGKFDGLQSNSTTINVTIGNDTVTITVQASNGDGDVSGPTSSLDNEIALFNGATGKIIKSSSKVLTTVGGNIAALTNPSAITFLRINADNTVTARIPTDLLTDLGFSTYIKTLIDDTNAATARTTLGVSRTLVNRDNTSVSLTGTVSETLLKSFLIPANTIQSNDIINLVSVFSKTAGVATASLNFKINTLNQVSGATSLGLLSSTASNRWSKMTREIICKNSLSSQVLFNPGNSTASDITSANATITTTSIDWTVDQYIMVSATLGNTSDSVTSESFYVEIIRL